MRRMLALAMLIALTLGVLAPGMAQAQSGTPAAAATGSFGVPMGTEVPIIGPDGSPIGTITVSNITDPFTGFDASSAPQRGYHYALAEVTIANTSASPMEVYPNYVMGIDNEGFVTDQPYMSFSDPAMTTMESTDALAAGSSITGVIPYQLFGDTTIQRIVYSPNYDRQITVLDLRTAPVVAGTPVSIMDTTGAAVAQVTVNGVTDPFTGYSSSSAPPRGSRYIMLDVSVTNTGTGVLSVSPSDFWVVDSEGFVLSSSYTSRTDQTLADFDYIDLNPGETQQGAIVYEVYEGVPPAQVSWGDGYTSLNVVADLSAGTGAAQPVSQPPAATEVAGAPTAAALPTEVGTTAAVASSPECDGLALWGVDLLDRVTRASALTSTFQDTDLATVTADQVTEVATQLRALGDEQAASNPPSAAATVNTIMVEQFYYPLADVVDDIATAITDGNMAGAMTAMQTAQGLTSVFDSGGPYDIAAAALTTACPAEVQQMNEATS